MKAPVDYTLDECVKNVGGRRFIVRNLTPNLNQETQRETKEKIEGELYNIFSKYMT